MPSLMGPQSQSGVMSFYDAPSNGPKLNPKIMMIIILSFAIIVMVKFSNYVLYLPGAIILPLIVAVWLGERAGSITVKSG
ncbi:MAG: preprotein translocase subunit Sec61beta, partial [Candidatus Marsarchaeota archaeon]|nr:preprotein translocase subunit Sec61beta [Candidatus Marsarchaeota archaeon]